MSRLFNEIQVNINSFGTFAAIIVLVFFIITFILFTLLFHRAIIIQYSILLQIIMLVYLSIFLMLTNSTDPDMTFHLSRLLYVSFMIHSVVSIFTVSYITSEDFYVFKAFSIISSLTIIGLIYINDTYMITRDIHVTTYYSAVKGPLFPITIIYILLTGIFMIMNYFTLYKKRPEDIRRLWPIYTGIIFFTFYTDFQGILLYVSPLIKPQLYIPVIVFIFLFLFFVFSEVKVTLLEREKMYLAYLYDDLTGVYTRNFILEEISETLHYSRTKNHYIAMIDIDGFKKINDTYGHIVGDRVLKTFGGLLNDLKLDTNLPGRLGGDEFIIFFKNCHKDKVIQAMHELLMSYTFALTKLNIDVLRTQTGLSIGLIDIDATMTLKDVLTLADKTMYDAKKNGKNTIRILDHS